MPEGSTCPFESATHEEDCILWNERANEFADFFSVVFLPHGGIYGGDLPVENDIGLPKLGWDEFCVRIKAMETRDMLIDRLRLKAMTTYIQSLPSNYRCRTLLGNFRHRATTIWTEEEKENAAKMYGSMRGNGYFPEDPDDFENGVSVTEVFGTSKIKDARRTLQFAADQVSTVRFVCGIPNPNLGQLPENNGMGNNTPTEEGKGEYERPNNTDILRFEDNHGKATHERAKSILNWTLPTTAAPATRREGERNNQKPVHNYKRKRDGSFIDPAETVESYIQLRNFKVGQLRIVRKFATYFLALKRKKDDYNGTLDFKVFHTHLPPPMTLLTGDPGTGKSYVIETITRIVDLLDLGSVATSSYNGIAAVNIDGSTICSMFRIHESGANCSTHLDSDSMIEIREILGGSGLCCVVIDEVSTIDSKVLALLSYRLQQITGNAGLPFGGLPMLLVGDFNQLGPVLKTFLPSDMMDWAVRVRRQESACSGENIGWPPTGDGGGRPVMFVGHKKRASKVAFSGDSKTKQQRKKEEDRAERFRPDGLAYYGCRLFSSFRRFHLWEQNRASQDPKHTDFVQRLSSGRPISLADILQYNTLTRADIAEDKEWKYAPLLVSTNLERLNITREKSRLWAVEHGTYVFKWRTKTTKHINQPPSSEMDSRREENSFFWQFWVPGAPANLKSNINGELALVNGSPVTTHSLTFADQEKHQFLLDHLNGHSAPPFGTEIEVEIPVSVNMIIEPTLDGKPMTNKRKKQFEQLKGFSIAQPTTESSAVILPITESMTKGNGGSDNNYSYRTYFPLCPIATVVSRPVFPFELSFAMTVHKAQGRTLEKVVIDLTDHPTHYARMKFAAVFVALSRVRRGSDIRLLQHTPRGKAFCPIEAYSYLRNLRPCRYCRAFYHGYTNTADSETEGMVWDLEKACSYTCSD